jgi:hypothetical protein
MPVIEAMACGARVALSIIPVFEEITDADARHIDPMTSNVGARPEWFSACGVRCGRECR